jgi:type IV secretion system protein TrbL
VKLNKLALGCIFLCIASAAFSQTATTDVTSNVVTQIQSAATNATAHLTAQALKWCGIFATLQFVISNIKIIRESGDIPQVVAKLTGSILWVGVVIYLINNGPAFIRNVGNQLQGLTGVTLPTPGSILATTFSLGGVGAVLAASTGPLAPVAGDILWDVDMLLMAIGCYFACKLFMMQLEVGLIAMMAPLSFSFLGLNAFRDQGFAPFKSLVALSFRVVLVGVVIQAYQGIFTDMQTAWTGLTWSQVLANGLGATFESTLTDLGALIVLTFVMFKSDSIAAALASGSSSLGPGDVVQAAAAGAAAGLAAHAAGNAIKSSKPAKNMGEFMKGLMGGGQGSITNASSMGVGGDISPMTTSAAAPASMSLGSGSGSGSGAVSRSGSGVVSTSGASSTTGSTKAGGSPSRSGLTSGRYGQEASNAAGAGPASAQGSAQSADGGASGADPGTGEDSATVKPAGASAASAGGSQSTVPTDSGPAGGAPSKEASAVPEAAPGSGLNAGVGSPQPGQSNVEGDLHRLVNHLTSQGGRKPSLGDRASDAGRHLSQEKATVSASLNPHHHD